MLWYLGIVLGWIVLSFGVCVAWGVLASFSEATHAEPAASKRVAHLSKPLLAPSSISKDKTVFPMAARLGSETAASHHALVLH